MSSTRVRTSIEWFVPLGQTRAITMALYSVAAETRSAPGCVSCSVSADFSNVGEVHYAEEWLTEDYLRLHLRSDTFSHLITLIDDATEPPHVEFMLPLETRGIDLVEEVRASTP